MKEIDVKGDDGLIIIYTAAVGGSLAEAYWPIRMCWPLICRYVWPFSPKNGYLSLRSAPVSCSWHHVLINIFHAGGPMWSCPIRSTKGTWINWVWKSVHCVLLLSYVGTNCWEDERKRLSSFQRSNGRKHHLSRMLQEFQALTKSVFFRVWGQTETLSFITACRHDEKPGSIGRPLPLTRLQIVDERERPVKLDNQERLWSEVPRFLKDIGI